MKTKILFQKLKKLIPRGIGEPLPLFVKSASGTQITDVRGKQFIDFTSGISATNLGHANKKVIQAIKAQAEKFLHTCFLVAPYENYLQLAEELHKLTPGKFAKKTFLANSGAEAVENAIKIARAYTSRPAIVSFTHGFHGRTLLALSLTSKVKPYKFGFGPFAPEIYHLEYPYAYRRPAHCQTKDEYIDYLLKQIEEEFFIGTVDPQHIAAVIIEPIAGEGGFIVAPDRYMRGLAKICKKYGIVLIVDEVQTGFGRTGKWFASEWSGITPDIIVLAKSLASGMPLSAVVGRREIMDSVQPGGLGGTFGGNPVCIAAALATIKEMKRLNLPERGLEVGKIIEHEFKKLERESPIVGEARGRGAMWALEIVKKSTGNKCVADATDRAHSWTNTCCAENAPASPDPARTKNLIKRLAAKGVLVLSAGLLGNDLRILPPLTINEKELREGLSAIKKEIS